MLQNNIFVYDEDGYTFWCLGQPTYVGAQFPLPVGCEAYVIHDPYRHQVWGYHLAQQSYFFLSEDSEHIDRAIEIMIRYTGEKNETSSL